MDVTICSVLMQAKVSNQTWGANSNKWWGTGEGTAPDSLQRGANSIWGCSKSVTVLLNYCQPQRKIHRKFYQWKLRNETSFRFKSFWAFEQSFFVAAKSACNLSVWKVHAEVQIHRMGSIWWDWLWWLSLPVVQKTGDDQMVGTSMKTVGSVLGCWC